MTIVLETIIFWFVVAIAIINIKYKPAYEVKIEGETVGYIFDETSFKNRIQEEIINQDGKNIEYVSLNVVPEYKKQLVARNTALKEEDILEKLKTEYTTITYKYFIVALNDEEKAYVDTIEEAEEIVDKIKSEYQNDEINLQILTKYTQNQLEINCDTIEVAERNVISQIEEIKIKEKEEEERKNALAIINEIKVSVLPVTGKITSRYGESSNLRRSTHTGTDIACSAGTDIKVIAKGKVTFAAYSGSYGNLVKIDHGNGVETWYGHCSKINVKAGQEVEAGDVIALVGSTGNSTGPHLHLEIRINGKTVNPQDYLY